jgi:hypothetical protein
MGFAAAACAHNWTPVCDSVQHRVDLAMPFLLVFGALFIVLAVLETVRRRKIK